MATKAKEAKVAEQYKYDHDEVIRAIDANDTEYLRTKLSQTSPLHIPHTAQIKPDHKKNGYEHVSYKWSDSGYNYESRWNTHTPNEPEYSHDSWVVTRTLPRIPAGKNHRQKEVKYLVKDILCMMTVISEGGFLGSGIVFSGAI